MGTGIYAIYYHGDFEAYEPVAGPNKTKAADPVIPIYVGKAVPQGARKGKVMADPTRSKALFNRLSEHAESILATQTLQIGDFSCRYLVVDEIWIPLWNLFVEGFGNHDPGSGRYEGLRPRWDVIHPGRAWAEKCKERKETDVEILRDIRVHLASTVMPQSAHFLGRADA